MKTMILAVALAVALMLAGCGGGGGSRIASTPTPEPEPTPEPVKGLPDDHTLETGTIPAGEMRTILEADGMRTTVTCPAGGDPCVITVASDGTATFTGGSPAVATAPIPEPTPGPEPYNSVSSAHWIHEPPGGWAGSYPTDASNAREFRETHNDYEVHSWWRELRSTYVLGYYGMQSRPGRAMHPWFERHADTVQPIGSSGSATWNGSFLGRAFRREFTYDDAGWTAANAVEARFADTETLADAGGTERPYSSKIIGDVEMSVSFTPGSSTTVTWSLRNSQTPTGDPFGLVVDQAGVIGTLTGMDRSYAAFTVHRDGTFSSSDTIPYRTRVEALAGGATPDEAFELSGAFVGTGGHGVLGTIDSRSIAAYSDTTGTPAVNVIQTFGLRGAFGAKRTP